MKILLKNLKSIFLSLSLFFISINIYSIDIENRCSSKVTKYVQKLSKEKLFNKLVKKQENLPCLIRFSVDYTLSDYKRWYVIMAMTKLAGKSIIPHLEKLKNDQRNSWLIRVAIAKSFSVISSPRAIDNLHLMLDDRSLLVRTVVVNLLSINSKDRTYNFLISEMDDKDNFFNGKSTLIRKHILEAIFKIGGKKSKKFLTLKLKDEDRAVAVRAKKYLEIINGSGEGI